VRKAIMKFRAIGGILRLLIFDNEMEWQTTSNAFEKSTVPIISKAFSFGVRLGKTAG